MADERSAADSVTAQEIIDRAADETRRFMKTMANVKAKIDGELVTIELPAAHRSIIFHAGDHDTAYMLALMINAGARRAGQFK